MNEESRIEALEHELKILKNEIQATLLEIREQILNHYYPELRAEEPMPMHSASLPVRPQVGRPGLPAKSAPRPQEASNSLSEIEAKGQVQPFSDIFLDDLSDEDEEPTTNELVNSRRPAISDIDADLDDDFEDDSDDNFEDLISDTLHNDFKHDSPSDSQPDKVANDGGNGAGPIKTQKIVPSSNTFGRTPKTREVDFRQLKQATATNKPTATSAPAKSEQKSESETLAPTSSQSLPQSSKTNRSNFAALATWVNDGVSKVGKERTIQIVETYATGGKLSSETKSSLLQLVSLAEEEEPASQVGSQDMLGLMVSLDQILR